MKYLYIILFIISFLGTSCSNNKVVFTEDNLPESVFYQENKIKPFTGKGIIYFHNTEIVKEEMHFQNGILNGPRISYYKNGKIKQQGMFKDGCYEGEWEAFEPCGTKSFVVDYKQDTLEGTFISWYLSGVIKEKIKYSDNRIIGVSERYDEAGMQIR